MFFWLSYLQYSVYRTAFFGRNSKYIAQSSGPFPDFYYSQYWYVVRKFNIVVTSLSHDFMPFVWSGYKFEWGEIWITIGTLWLVFLLGCFLFVRNLKSGCNFAFSQYWRQCLLEFGKPT